jgi:hypothetical protein
MIKSAVAPVKKDVADVAKAAEALKATREKDREEIDKKLSSHKDETQSDVSRRMDALRASLDPNNKTTTTVVASPPVVVVDRGEFQGASIGPSDIRYDIREVQVGRHHEVDASKIRKGAFQVSRGIPGIMYRYHYGWGKWSEPLPVPTDGGLVVPSDASEVEFYSNSTMFKVRYDKSKL